MQLIVLAVRASHIDADTSLNTRHAIIACHPVTTPCPHTLMILFGTIYSAQPRHIVYTICLVYIGIITILYEANDVSP